MIASEQDIAAMERADDGRPETVGEVLLRHFATIGTYSDEDAKALASVKAREISVERHTDVLKIGDRPTVTIVVLKGWMYRHSNTRNGNRQVQGFYMPEDAPCMETLHVARMDHNLAALTPARLGLIEHAELKRVFGERPNLLHLAWRDTLIMASVYREWLNRNGRMDAASALAHLFCEVLTRAKAAGFASGDSCDFPATQEVIGEALALTSVHVNRTLQLLRQTGLVEFSGGRLTINDFERLADLAEFDPQYLHLRGGPTS